MIGWRKSSYSNPSGNCVEVLTDGAVVAVRDSKNPDGPLLILSAAQWAVLMAAVKKEDCPDCEGRGLVRLYAQSRWQPCGLCGGNGRMTG